MRQKLGIAWNIPNHDVQLRQFNRYLRDKGVRPSTLNDYIQRARKYLEFCGSDQPTPEKAQEYRNILLDRKLSRSSVNNYCFAVKNFHKMLGQDIGFTFLKRSNEIPYFFKSSEINKIFDLSIQTDKLMSQAEQIEFELTKLAEQVRTTESTSTPRKEFPMYG